MYHQSKFLLFDIVEIGSLFLKVFKIGLCLGLYIPSGIFAGSTLVKFYLLFKKVVLVLTDFAWLNEPKSPKLSKKEAYEEYYYCKMDSGSGVTYSFLRQRCSGKECPL